MIARSGVKPSRSRGPRRRGHVRPSRRSAPVYAHRLWPFTVEQSTTHGRTVLTTPHTCRYMISRTDRLTGRWSYGHLCGKPPAPDLAPGTPAYEAGACLDHVQPLALGPRLPAQSQHHTQHSRVSTGTNE